MTRRSEGGQKRASYGPPRIRILSTKYRDNETGLYYYGYRYYSSELGRWLSRDPRGEAGSLNLYLFVYNNPLYFIDPFGLNPIESFIVSLSGVLDKSLNAAIESLGWNDPNLATRLQSGVEWQLESSGLYTLDETISSIFQVVYITSIGAEYAAGYALLAGPQGIITGAGGVLLLADAGDKTQELFTGRNKFREWVDSMPITDKERQIILCSKEIAVIIIEGAGFASYAPKGGTQHVFWSGGRTAEDAARSFAKANNGVIVGDTAAGQAVSQTAKGIPWSEARPQWLSISEDFARTASGDVNVFQNARGLSFESIWRNEYQILKQNPNVNSINFHIVMPDGSVIKVP